MRILCLQHVPFEDLGRMQPLLSSRGHHIQSCPLYQGITPPAQETFDALVVMGGPMGIHDEDQYPWLSAEKIFLRQAIDAGKIILGICLGAQLIADVLGAEITRNPHREIGWFEIQSDPALTDTPWAKIFPNQAEVFHWHGDTFAIPEGAIPIASSVACAHQGFIHENRVIGLQFHLETTEATAQRLIQHCADELDGSAYVQSAQEMLSQPERFDRLIPMLTALWDRLETAV